MVRLILIALAGAVLLSCESILLPTGGDPKYNPRNLSANLVFDGDEYGIQVTWERPLHVPGAANWEYQSYFEATREGELEVNRVPRWGYTSHARNHEGFILYAHQCKPGWSYRFYVRLKNLETGPDSNWLTSRLITIPD